MYRFTILYFSTRLSFEIIPTESNQYSLFSLMSRILQCEFTILQFFNMTLLRLTYYSPTDGQRSCVVLFCLFAATNCAALTT